MDFYTTPKGTAPPGLTLGKVVANYDDKHKGKIQVAYYTYDGKGNTTDWIRVASFAAGKGRGAYFLPEVGDEVIVAYLNNDRNNPCVIGSLWNVTDSYPEGAVTEENTVKAIVTRSGIKILVNDEKDKEGVTVITPKKAEITISDENETITVKDGGGKNKIEIDGKNGGITIVSESKLTIKSKEIELDADKDITLKASNININASGKLAVAGAQSEVKASGGALDLKGSMVKING